MKKCPNCQKTFDDDKRFCQVDGTPLVDVVEPPQTEDPYKTVVIGSQKPVETADDPMKTMVINADPKEDDILQIPEVFDPMKTVVVSEPIKLDAEPPAPPKLDEPVVPAPPKFNEPDLSPPSFRDLSSNEPPIAFEPPISEKPISSPFSEPPKVETPIANPFNEPPKVESPFSTPFNEPSKPIEPPKFDVEKKEPFDINKPFSMPPSEPIPSPFEEKSTPPPPVFKEPEPAFGVPPSPFDSPFNQPNEPVISQPIQQTEWTPPPAPNQSWQNQSIGAETPFQPPVAGSGGQNNTLAMVSLVLGILSFVCLGVLGAVPAVITGYMQKNKIKSNPMEYGGGGLATVGMVLGVVNIILTVVLTILYIVLVVLATR